MFYDPRSPILRFCVYFAKNGLFSRFFYQFDRKSERLSNWGIYISNKMIERL